MALATITLMLAWIIITCTLVTENLSTHRSDVCHGKSAGLLCTCNCLTTAVAAEAAAIITITIIIIML